MRQSRLFWGVSALMFLAVASGMLGCTAPEPVSREDQLVNRLNDALGGRENWEKTRFIRFKFGGRRMHYWDKHQGRARLEFPDREGNNHVVLLDLDSRQGRAFRNREEMQGEEKEQALQTAYGAWINDTYWLVMPYKMRDPGVTLSYEGEEEIDGRMYDKLLLTFESVGLTPNDRYWAYLNRDTGLMDRWAYVLQQRSVEGNPPGEGPPTMWEWHGWQKYGKIMLAPGRRMVGDDRNLPLDDIAVFDELPESVFTSPEPVE